MVRGRKRTRIMLCHGNSTGEGKFTRIGAFSRVRGIKNMCMFQNNGDQNPVHTTLK